MLIWKVNNTTSRIEDRITFLDYKWLIITQAEEIVPTRPKLEGLQKYLDPRKPMNIMLIRTVQDRILPNPRDAR